MNEITSPAATKMAKCAQKIIFLELHWQRENARVVSS
jgi:hypothetical protein